MDNGINVDKAAHRVYEFHLNSILRSGTFIDKEWLVFYHEDRLYSVYNSNSRIISLVFANSPHHAIKRVKDSLKERENNAN